MKITIIFGLQPAVILRPKNYNNIPFSLSRCFLLATPFDLVGFVDAADAVVVAGTVVLVIRFFFGTPPPPPPPPLGGDCTVGVAFALAFGRFFLKRLIFVGLGPPAGFESSLIFLRFWLKVGSNIKIITY